MRKPSLAFTLIELLLALAIVGIMVGLSVPRFKKSFEVMRLDSFSGQLHDLISYLSQESVTKEKVIYLNIDNSTRIFRAFLKEEELLLRSLKIPQSIMVESDKENIFFYPDGQIDKVTLALMGPDKNRVVLTTKGVYGGVKLQKQD